MDDNEFFAWAGTDASRWAEDFCKKFPSVLSQVDGQEGVVDGADLEGLMSAWFANAIEAGALREAREAQPVIDQIAVLPALQAKLKSVESDMSDFAESEIPPELDWIDKWLESIRAALSLLDSGETVE